MKLRCTSQTAWLKLARARWKDVQSGKIAMLAGDEALARVRARIAAATGPGRIRLE